MVFLVPLEALRRAEVKCVVALLQAVRKFRGNKRPADGVASRFSADGARSFATIKPRRRSPELYSPPTNQMHEDIEQAA